MKQLLALAAKYLKPEDYIFDFSTRVVEKIEYVQIENADGTAYDRQATLEAPKNVHVSYGTEAERADNFHPDTIVHILIDTDTIPIFNQNATHLSV